MSSKRRERINHSILGDAHAQAWSNLGLWQTGQTDYRTAAQALALQLAEQMRLQAASSLLDVACGYGASLNVWHEMGIREITGLEPQTACVQAWQTDHRFQCWHDSMQNISLLSQGQPFEAIIAIDAAYNFSFSDSISLETGILVHLEMTSEIVSTVTFSCNKASSFSLA